MLYGKYELYESRPNAALSDTTTGSAALRSCVVFTLTQSYKTWTCD